jgi:hypothetical protein
MQVQFTNHLLPHLQQQIAEEERNYQESLRQDVPFWTLKEIRMKIKKLRLEMMSTTNLQESR